MMEMPLLFNKFRCSAIWIVVLAVSTTFLFIPALVQSETLLPGKAKGSSKTRSDRSIATGQPDRISVLVHLKPTANRSSISNFARDKGGFLKYEYKTVLPNVMNLRNIPVKAIEALERIPGVERVVEDKYHENVLKLDESTPLIRGLQSQNSGAGYSADGAGVRICVCDTGIDTDHIMYSDRIDFEAGFDFYNDDDDPEDDHGHGSHVAGIAVGGTGLIVDLGCEGEEPFQGVAPKATLIGVKILNRFGGGRDSDIIAGINYCADQSASGGRADVINLSIGTGGYSGPCSHLWAVAANNAVAAGVVVVAASGNENYANALSSPACGSDVIAVGATYKNDYPNCEDSYNEFPWGNCTDISPSVDDIVCFSNESDYLDVTAPGAVILSASTDRRANRFTEMSGTSMAAPHVAGLAALILNADPSLTPAEVRQIIRDGAIDMGPAGFDSGYGYGRIDVIRSLALISPCPGDYDPDGDIDGQDLAHLIALIQGGLAQPEDEISDFATFFGLSSCYLPPS
jgi:serine protease AprX